MAEREMAKTHHQLTEEDERRLISIFQQIEDDKGGKIDRYELLSCMTKLHGKDKAAEEVARIFEITDNDVSSLITYRELKSMLASAS